MKKQLFIFFIISLLLIQNVSTTVGCPVQSIQIEEGDVFFIASKVIDPNKPMIAITFDDGPTRSYTIKILDCLKNNNASATFFVLGSRIEGSEDLLERMIQEGHEIGNHTYSHKQLNILDESSIEKEITMASESIYEVIHKYPILLRCPYGESNSIVEKYSTGMSIIKWNQDSEDWKSQNTTTIVNKVLAEVEDGNIILFHDLYEETAEAICILVPKLIEEGYQLVTVSELLSFENE